MTIAMAYLVAPVVLAMLCVGAGLGLAALRPRAALGSLTAPAGLAVIVIVGTVTTYTATTARWTTPAVVAVAVLGAALFGWFRRRELTGAHRRIDWWPLVVAVACFTIFAAPVAMSGAASWAGWIKLDDTATWLAFTDQLMTAGRAIPEPMTSTFERLIDVNFRGTYGGTAAQQYPLGSFPPLGVLSQLTASDVAWLIHPYMSTVGALLGLCIYRVLQPLVRRRWVRAAAAIVATQGATLFAYVLWGGIKEILLAMLLALLAVSVAEATPRRAGWRDLTLPAIASVAFLACTGKTGAGYLVPLLGAGALIWWIARRPRSGAIAAAAVVSAAVTATVLLLAGVLTIRLTGVPEDGDIGNLIRPLNPWQAVGIWITPDFRFDPDQSVATTVLVAVTVLLAVVGLVAALRRRAWALPLLVGSTVLVLASSQVLGGAWLAGKAMAICSPGILAAAFAGAAALWARGAESGGPVRRASAPNWRRTGARTVGVVGAAAVAIGVLWSNSLAYKAVWLAPTDQTAELEQIGRDFEGQGPTLMTDFSIFGGRHFLRDLDTEVAAELRVNQIPLRDGTVGQKGQSFDVSAFPPSTLEAYPLLVLRRSPIATRPPANYERIREGTYYDVWQRIPGSAPIPDDVVLDGPYAVPDDQACAAIYDLAATDTDGRRLVGSVRPSVTISPLGTGPLPDGWTPTQDGMGVTPSGPGALSMEVEITEPGEFEIWLAGSYPGRLTATVDGAPLRTGASVIEPDTDHVNSLGTVTLGAGAHEIVVSYDTPWWAPGTDAGPFPFGPLYLTTVPSDGALVEVPASRASELCSLDLEWVTLAPIP